MGEERYRVLDLVQEFVGEREGRQRSKSFVYSAIRSFFMHNRVDLPRDRSFKVRSEAPNVVGDLTVDEVRRVLYSCNECYRAVFLCMFQGGMGGGELIHWSDRGWSSLYDRLRRGLHPVRVDLPGRKQRRNRSPFYTFLGRDAVDALKVWLRVRLGDAEAIFINQFGAPLDEHSLRMYWTDHLKRLGIVEQPPDAGPSTRYGKNPHELRDLFRTRWQKSGAAAEAAEFFMGHVIDPNEYNKAFRDEDYAAGEYLKAEPWLNILSEDPEKVPVRDYRRLQQRLQEERRELREELRELRELVDTLRTRD
ncbi:MAG: site-specific integrase [Candidatus Bathyarchaeota archaeon]|nr:site-specific integrase [Candidatus Bathyarchaeota archaeon]